MNTSSRHARLLVALIISLAALGFASASPATAAASAPRAAAKPPVQVKLSAELLDTKVKVNGKARIKGKLDVVGRSAGVQSLEAVVVQQLQAGVWVDVANGSCRPNNSFTLSVSFSLAAQYTLRLYHPETVIYTSAWSDVFVLAVLP